MSGAVHVSQTDPIIVERTAANLPQATQTDWFTVTGSVTITKITAEVTTQIQAQETAVKWISNPTVGADVDMCAALDITAAAVGSTLRITGTPADAMVLQASGAAVGQATWIDVAAGTIDLDTDDDSSTGALKVTIHYVPVSSDGAIVVA